MKIPKNIDLSVIPTPSGTQLVNEVVKIIDPEAAGSQGGGDPRSEEVAVLTKALISIANQSWRISNAVIDPDSKEPKEKLEPQEIKKMNRALEATEATLKELGIDLKDRLGEPFDVGLPYEVMTELPQDGISKERVINTIEPTISWNHTMVQRGKIEIAVPTDKKTTDEK
jgi:hypothetical protein